MSLRLHALRHESFEDEAEIGAWARSRGHAVAHANLHLGEPLPGLDAFDWLVVMGGAMNIDEEDRFPFLAAEKRLIREAAESGRRVLGVCLGAQLISAALGGQVTKNRQREIGWHPVELTDAADACPVFRGLPRRFTAFHWHGDTFSIPPGALWTAKSEACDHQAFSTRAGRVVGLQFHLETSAASMAGLAEACAQEITASPYVQSAAEMLAHTEHLPPLRALLDRMLDNMAALG